MKKTTFGFLIALGIGINTAIWLSLKNHPGISAENGPMENFQAACLGLGFLSWLMAGCISKNRAEKIFLFGLALFNLSFLVLEVDTRNLDAPILNKFFNGRIRDAWLGCLWLVVGIFFFKAAKPVWNIFLSWIKSSSGILMIVSGVFWIISGLIDKSLLGRKELYREELMEVNSTPLMLLAAIFVLLRKKESPQLQKDELPAEAKQQP